MSTSVKKTGKNEKREYENVKKAKQCKERLLKIADPYFEKEIVPNSGQLKFLKDLMIRQIAVSTNVKINAPRKRMEEYMEKSIFGNEYSKEIIEIFDSGKNLKAYLNSVYCDEIPFAHRLLEKEPSKEGEIPFPPYLLLQKTQEAVEVSMNWYMNRRDSEKLEAYSDFLIGVAWYEILLREFFKALNCKMEEYKIHMEQMDDCRVLEQYLEQAKHSSDNEEIKFIAGKMAEDAMEYLSVLGESEIILHTIFYFICQQTNFYALLRILVLVEWGNIHFNQIRDKKIRNEQEKVEYLENSYWESLMGKLMEENELLGFTERKKNLGNLYHKFDEMISKSSLGPILKNENIDGKKFRGITVDLYNQIMMYLEGIKIPLSKRKENKLWAVENKLAEPLWEAVETLSVEWSEKHGSDICQIRKGININGRKI